MPVPESSLAWVCASLADFIRRGNPIFPRRTADAEPNDLRLLGQVLRLCHEQPVFEAVREDGQGVPIRMAPRA